MAFQLQFHARASHRRGSRRRQRHRRSPGCFLLFRRCASQDPGYRLTRYFVVVTSFSIRVNIGQESQSPLLCTLSTFSSMLQKGKLLRLTINRFGKKEFVLIVSKCVGIHLSADDAS